MQRFHNGGVTQKWSRSTLHNKRAGLNRCARPYILINAHLDEEMDGHPAGLQMQLRQNNEELTDYLKGLDDWEEEMKEKDQSLSKNKSILREVIPYPQYTSPS